MNSRDAKQILWIYRAGTDRDEPQFADALSAMVRDSELRRWVEQQDVVFQAVRRKLSGIDVPRDLREKIVRQRPIEHSTTQWLRPVLQIAAVLLVFASLTTFWLRSHPKNNFAAYEGYVTRLVSGKYHMSYESNDRERIRLFLERNQAPAQYALPPALTRTTALGCATLSWSGNPVSMLCFTDAQQRKLWLFVTSRDSIPDSPRKATPSFEQHAKGFVSASWTANGYTYVLTMQGDAQVLSEYL